jgi:hypothetical protein
MSDEAREMALTDGLVLANRLDALTHVFAQGDGLIQKNLLPWNWGIRQFQDEIETASTVLELCLGYVDEDE